MQDRILVDLSQWGIQFAFFAAVLHTVLYGGILRFRWWATPTGRVIFALGPCVAGALLRAVLLTWGVPIAKITSRGYTAPWYGTVLTWVALVALFGCGVIMLTLAWQAVIKARNQPAPEEQQEEQ